MRSLPYHYHTAPVDIRLSSVHGKQPLTRTRNPRLHLKCVEDILIATFIATFIWAISREGQCTTTITAQARLEVMDSDQSGGVGFATFWQTFFSDWLTYMAYWHVKYTRK